MRLISLQEQHCSEFPCEDYADAVSLTSLCIGRSKWTHFLLKGDYQYIHIFIPTLDPSKGKWTFHFTFWGSRVDSCCLLLWDAEHLFWIVQMFDSCQEVFRALGRLSRYASPTPVNGLWVQVTVHCTSVWTNDPVFSPLPQVINSLKTSLDLKGTILSN